MLMVVKVRKKLVAYGQVVVTKNNIIPKLKKRGERERIIVASWLRRINTLGVRIYFL